MAYLKKMNSTAEFSLNNKEEEYINSIIKNKKNIHNFEIVDAENYKSEIVKKQLKNIEYILSLSSITNKIKREELTELAKMKLMCDSFINKLNNCNLSLFNKILSEINEKEVCI